MRVAVAGAGIAGLTAAIALACRGFAVDLFEQSPRLDEIGAGIQLSPNAMAALDALGIADDLDGWVEPAAIDIRDARSGRNLAAIPLGATARSRYGAPYRLIHRADLQAGLLTAARRHAEIHLHLHSELRDARATEEGVVFTAGGRSYRADLLIGAEGLHSRLRTGHFGHPGPRPLGAAAWRATLDAACIPGSIRQDVAGLWLAAGAHLVHYPMQGGASFNVVVIARGAASAPQPPVEPFGPAARQLLDAVATWTCWPLADVDERLGWTRARVALIGDAAHAMVPSAAQGGAQAIEDAVTLAAALAARGGNPAALAAWERARRPRVERVAREAKRNLAIYGMSGLPAAVRNAFLGALPAQLLLARLDWLFRWRPEIKFP